MFAQNCSTCCYVQVNSKTTYSFLKQLEIYIFPTWTIPPFPEYPWKELFSRQKDGYTYCIIRNSKNNAYTESLSFGDSTTSSACWFFQIAIDASASKICFDSFLLEYMGHYCYEKGRPKLGNRSDEARLFEKNKFFL